MINIANNPIVHRQLAEVSEASQLPGTASDSLTQSAVDKSESSAYPSKKLELIEGRYRVLGAEK